MEIGRGLLPRVWLIWILNGVMSQMQLSAVAITTKLIFVKNGRAITPQTMRCLMAMVLVDASFLVAVGYSRSPHHQGAVALGDRRRRDLVIPDVVLTEAMYNIIRLGGQRAGVAFGRLLLSQSPILVALTNVDFARALEVMAHYPEAELDFVDCCLTALAERLKITEIATFDRRDFSIIRPNHAPHFTLLP
jgi:uncharacterized protein